MHDSRLGHPCVFHRDLYPELLSLSGDRGARRVIERHPAAVCYVALETDRAFADIDTHKDFEQLGNL
jgi:molybdenum cofactor cytidylyltransferase